MVDSFRRIDYSLRPAKYAERRMLSDVFRRLVHFRPVEDYRYVGFGSVWFSDFILFHRSLGIRKMYSIEQAAASQKRFEANKPFAIEMDFRPSNTVLPELDYSEPQIIWLDYDDPITLDMVNDVAIISRYAASGTVLIVSVQCVRPPDVSEAQRARESDPYAVDAIERFSARMSADGVSRIPPEIDELDLSNWAFGELSRSIFYSEIDRVLGERNLTSASSPISYRKICDIEYEDGAKMTSIALIFHDEEDTAKVDACAFNSLSFIDSKNHVFIPSPKITPKEYRSLESQLPLPAGASLDIGHIPPKEARYFPEMYRYFPSFVAVETLG